MTHTDQTRHVLLTVEETARRLGLGRTTVFGLIRTGELHSVRIGRARRVPTEAIGDYVRRLSTSQQRAA
ncbi:helix-turn-helix domain-containing protein [Saccharopolyspora sp. 6V]|uniref:helix-turn-helix domain-containing protein n=1 Tax=Saccharopolyspora sp. 6V TaxID=2877239 RepID=UPI001CD57EB4|nr:helix-turn-helix domain-containing protein [Saccharopolyspora sp. 6V]MCA1194432.1 helix-turn-helix domain-containing protein [Saccharopolyspora sp. 6V]